MTINQAALLRKALPREWRVGVKGNFMDQLILLLLQASGQTDGGESGDSITINEAESELISTYSAVSDLSDRLEDLERNMIEIISGEDISDRLKELDDDIQMDLSEEFKTFAVDGGVHEATDREFITAALSATIVMPAQPMPNSVIIVKKIDNSRQIMIGGNGRTIDGCTTVTIRNKNTALTMQYDVERNGWFIR